MLLYCNGDYHVTGAMAVNNHITAETDPQYKHLGKSPHPDNLKISWPRKLSDPLKAGLHIGKNSDVVNHIVADARAWINSLSVGLRSDVFIIIQWPVSTPTDHERIWQFHNHLDTIKVKHLFYSSKRAFFRVRQHHAWGETYIEPYNKTQTYVNTLVEQGFETVSPESQYFGKEAHSFWAQFLLQYVINQGMV